MARQGREDLKKTFMGSAGWLFADLLLALAMLFLVANTVQLPQPPVVSAKPKPTATAIATPKAQARPLQLESTYHRFNITVDPDKVLSNDAAEKNAVIQQVLKQDFLHNRSVGLVIATTGSPSSDPGDRAVATKVSSAIYTILLDLGKRNATFARTSKYDSLFYVGNDSSTVTLDLFLFAQ